MNEHVDDESIDKLKSDICTAPTYYGEEINKHVRNWWLAWSKGDMELALSYEKEIVKYKYRSLSDGSHSMDDISFYGMSDANDFLEALAEHFSDDDSEWFLKWWAPKHPSWDVSLNEGLTKGDKWHILVCNSPQGDLNTQTIKKLARGIPDEQLEFTLEIAEDQEPSGEVKMTLDRLLFKSNSEVVVDWSNIKLLVSVQGKEVSIKLDGKVMSDRCASMVNVGIFSLLLRAPGLSKRLTITDDYPHHLRSTNLSRYEKVLDLFMSLSTFKATYNKKMKLNARCVYSDKAIEARAFSFFEYRTHYSINTDHLDKMPGNVEPGENETNIPIQKSGRSDVYFDGSGMFDPIKNKLLCEVLTLSHYPSGVSKLYQGAFLKQYVEIVNLTD